ncbi:MAG: Na+/H+ antiporter subunit E [Hyphomonadaceae bacterium]|nr:Na+/H+ antiporter subunit E [Hyphomonadaceae bacterium]
MLQAAAMLVGLSVAWLLLTQSAWTPQNLALAGFVGVVCVGATMWLGGWRGIGAPPLLALANLRRAPGNFRAALGAARAAIAADISLRPALILIKPRPGPVAVKAALIAAINAAPGQMAVESDGDGLLAHVLDEEAVQPEQISELEDGVRAAYGLGAVA